MKKTLLLLSVVLFTGCAPTRPPSAPERALYSVETNYVDSVLPSSTPDGATVAVTNRVPVYRLVPKPSVEVGIGAAGSLGGLFGFGGLAGLVLGAVYHIYAQLRNRKVTAALVQGTETVLEVLRTTPQGEQLRDRAVSWLQEQQSAAGVVDSVTKLVRVVSDTRAARAAAQEVRDGQ